MHARGECRRRVQRTLEKLYLAEPLETRRLLALSVPLLSSLPGAPVNLFLDFDGSAAFNWTKSSERAHGPGGNNVPIPAFSYDSDADNFSTFEHDTLIPQIWQVIAEKYSPFEINVTTATPPTDLVRGRDMDIIIGGSDSDWCNRNVSGISQRDGFTNSDDSDIGFAFSGDYRSLDPVKFVRFVGETAAHEAGHIVGLYHQSKFDGSGNLLEEYSKGSSTEAPIMGAGNNQYNKRGVWAVGTASEKENDGTINYVGIQDDLAIITRPSNGILYSSSANGGTLSFDATGTVITPITTATSLSGILPLTSSIASWDFTPTSAQVTLNIDNAQFGGMLAPTASLFFNGHPGNATLTLSDSGPNSRAALTCTGLQPGQTYTLRVQSRGGYGQIGQYRISGQEVVLDIASYDPATRKVKVSGAAGDNNVEISDDADFLYVRDTVGGNIGSESFPIADVDHVSVDLSNGNNDTITIFPLSYFKNAIFHSGPDVDVSSGVGIDTLNLKSSQGNNNPNTFDFEINNEHSIAMGTTPVAFSGTQTVNLYGGGGIVLTTYNLHSWGFFSALYIHGSGHVDSLNVDGGVADGAGRFISFDGGGGNDTFTIDDTTNQGGTPSGGGDDITFIPKTFSISSIGIFSSADGGVREFDYSNVPNIVIKLGTGQFLGAGPTVDVDELAGGTNLSVYGNPNDISFWNVNVGFTDPHGFPQDGSPFTDAILGNVFVYGNSVAGLVGAVTIDDRDHQPAASYTVYSNFIANSNGGEVIWDGVTEVDFYSANAGSSLTVNGIDTTIPIHLFGGSGLDGLIVDDRSMANRRPSEFDLYADHVTRFFASSPTFETFTYSGYEGLNLYMNTQETTEHVYSTPTLPSGQQVTMTGSSNPDSFTIYPRDAAGNPTILGNIGIIGGTGADIVNFMDNLAAIGTTWTVSNPFGATTQNFAVTGSALMGALNDVEVLAIYGSSGDDTFNVNTFKAGTTFNINAGAGNDTLNFGNGNLSTNITSLAGFGFDGQAGSDTFNFNDASDGSGTYQRGIFSSGVGLTTYVAQIGPYNIGLLDTNTELLQIYPAANGPAVDVEAVMPGQSTAVHFNSPASPGSLRLGNSTHTLTQIQGAVIFDGGSAGSSININDSADTTGRTMHLTQNSLGAFPGDTLFPAGGSLTFNKIVAGFVPALVMNLGSGADTIYAQPNPTGTIMVTGGNPTTSPGDTIGLALAAAQNPVVNGTAASGSVTSSNLRTLSYSGFENGPNIDAAAPQVQNAGVNVNGVLVGAQLQQAVDVQFNEAVFVNGGVGAVILNNLVLGQIIPQANMALMYEPGVNTAHFTFPAYANGILPDGNYHGTVVNGQAQDTFGNGLGADATFDFFSLTADANHDRHVDSADFSALAVQYNQPSTFSQGDFNYDGHVNGLDFNLLASKFGTFLAPPGSAPAIQSAASLSSARVTADLFGATPIRAGDDCQSIVTAGDEPNVL